MTPPDRMRQLLRPLVPLYAAGAELRRRAYDGGLLRAHDPGLPVVSIGNLTTGGTGKSPIVRLVARELLAMGAIPGILLRGYGARGALARVPEWREAPPDGALARFGDEALEHTRALGPAAIVVAHPDRLRGAGIARAAGADVLVLDDGFQHRRIARDVDVVCLDARSPLGRGGLLPAGDLREPPAALARADLVMWTRAIAPPPHLPALRPDVPSVEWRHEPGRLRGAGSDADATPGRVAVAARIADPDDLSRTAAAAGLEVVAAHGGRDHAIFRAGELEALRREVESGHADAILVSAKDEPRLLDTTIGRSLAGSGRAVVLELRLVASGDRTPLRRALEVLIERTKARPGGTGTGPVHEARNG